MPRVSNTEFEKAEINLKNEIIGIILFGFAVLSFTSLFFQEDTGGVGGFLFRVFTGITGKGAYVLPIFFLLYGLIKFRQGTLNKLVQRVVAATIIYTEFLVVFHMQYLPKEVWEKAWNGQGGGVLGGVLSYVLFELFGKLGTIIVLACLFLICLILLTGGSIVIFIRNCLKTILKFFGNVCKEIKEFIVVEEDIDEDEDDTEGSPSLVDEPNCQCQRFFDLSEINNFASEKETNSANIIDNNSSQKTSYAVFAEKVNLEDEDSMDTSAGTQTYLKPPLSLLQKREPKGKEDVTKGNQIKIIEETLASFGVTAKVTSVAQGPSVTRYELQPAPGIKVSKIVSLSDDLALSLAAPDVRIEAPIPGKAAVGIEVPNRHVSIVTFREMIENEGFQRAHSRLTIALGKDVAGEVIIADLASMPHLLVAGATGSGKSVCINTIINSILYKATPEEVKMLLIDPKMVELNVYNGIPHLISPVVTDPKKAAGALKWIVKEMENRYRLFAAAGARDISSYNDLEMQKENPQLLPQIMVVIDELADLMMVAPNDVEDSICRLAQMARAAGIHLVVATQRPSVDVITGLIKANIPSRISFAVSSQIDSRTILDMAGAEKLIGKGDMLYLPVGAPKPLRVQGAFISNGEVEQIVRFIKRQRKAEYESPPLIQHEEDVVEEEEGPSDELFADAVRIVVESRQASISLLQRRLRVGYARAARLVDMLEEAEIIGPYEGSKPREVLMSLEEYRKRFER